MASGGGAEGEPEFQIAPMIDVLLVLLIFFMSIATSTVARYDPSINLPVATDAAKKDDAEGELVFNVAWKVDEQVAVTTFEENVVNPVDTIPTLVARKKANELLNQKVHVLIRSDNNTPVRHVSAIVNAAAQAGISDVTFATLNR